MKATFSTFHVCACVVCDIVMSAVFLMSPASMRAEDFIPYVSQQDMRIALEVDGRVFSRLLADEMARLGWHTVSQTLGSVSFYRPITKDLAEMYAVPAATDLENPEYVQEITGYFYVRPVRTACVSFESSISFEGKHHVEELKKVAVPEQVKKLTKTVTDKMPRKSFMWISFRE